MKRDKDYFTVEQGSRGATYQNDADTWTVYQHGFYDESSVLAGQHRRQWCDEFPTLADALKAYPDAIQSGSSYAPASLNHLPDPDGSDPFGDNEEAAQP